MLIGKAPLVYTEVPLLQKNLAKALIESGVFDHGPSKVVWALPVTPPVDKAGSNPEVAGGGAATQVVLKGLINAAKLSGRAQAKTPAEALGFKPKLRPPAQTGSNTVDAHIAIPAPVFPLPVTIPRMGQLQPVKVPRGSSKRVERAFGVVQAVVPVTHQIGNHPAIGVAGDAAVGLVASAEDPLTTWYTPRTEPSWKRCCSIARGPRAWRTQLLTSSQPCNRPNPICRWRLRSSKSVTACGYLLRRRTRSIRNQQP